MIQVGQTFSLGFQLAHRIEATVIELRDQDVVAECVHRCVPTSCYLQAERTTLPLHGTIKYPYDFFAKYFVPMADDAIALAGAHE